MRFCSPKAGATRIDLLFGSAAGLQPGGGFSKLKLKIIMLENYLASGQAYRREKFNLADFQKRYGSTSPDTTSRISILEQQANQRAADAAELKNLQDERAARHAERDAYKVKFDALEAKRAAPYLLRQAQRRAWLKRRGYIK